VGQRQRPTHPTRRRGVALGQRDQARRRLPDPARGGRRAGRVAGQREGARRGRSRRPRRDPGRRRRRVA
jgi:hypothetical protein